MLTTLQVLDLDRSDAARIERFTQRREVFLDALDWKMLTCEQVHEAAMLDFMLEDDPAEALQRLSMVGSIICVLFQLAVATSRPGNTDRVRAKHTMPGEADLGVV